MSVHAEGKKLGKCYMGLHKGEKIIILNLFYYWVNKSFSEQEGPGFKIFHSTSAGFIL